MALDKQIMNSPCLFFVTFVMTVVLSLLNYRSSIFCLGTIESCKPMLCNMSSVNFVCLDHSMLEQLLELTCYYGR
ncbi:hypothetical protein BDR04DRAFT_1085373 [Suillus decipiens]|nr:hypothetical protein BDR04DRAFT_1085373 [Suillus decipiens]